MRRGRGRRLPSFPVSPTSSPPARRWSIRGSRCSGKAERSFLKRALKPVPQVRDGRRSRRDDLARVRRLALAAVLTVALSTGVALAARNPHAEREHLTSTGAKLAGRALLRGSDLGPDWTKIPAAADDSTFRCTGFDPDLSAFTVNGRASTVFVHSALATIGSSSDVYASRAQAVGDLRAGAKPQLAGCLRQLTERAFRASAGAAIKASVLSSRMVHAPRIGEHSAAYRLVSRLRANGLTLRAYTDLLVFQRGRTIAVLVFTGIDSPVPSQIVYGRSVAARMR
jgi:hypothetical protein